MIRELRDDGDILETVRVIRASFATVAADLGLNEENCPSHPSNLTEGRLRESIGRGMRCYGLFVDGVQAGFVGIERTKHGDLVMERLAVLPEHRHRGHGKRLVEFVFSQAKEAGAQKVLIGIIDEHTVLKDWYASFGFVVSEIKRFEHLPFAVCLMEKRL